MSPALCWILSPGDSQASVLAHYTVAAGELVLIAAESSIQPLSRLGLMDTQGSSVHMYFIDDDQTLTPTWLRFPDQHRAELFLSVVLASYQEATSLPFPTSWLQRDSTHPPEARRANDGMQ